MTFTFNGKKYKWNYRQFGKMVFELVTGTAAIMGFYLAIVYAFIGGF